MKPVTIDQLDIKDHVRWAQDQEGYDISFVKESHIIAQHPEILGTSVIYPSKFEELFELQRRNLPWANFSPPRNFHMFNKRLFSYRLFPNIYWDDNENEEESSEEEMLLPLLLIICFISVLKNSFSKIQIINKQLQDLLKIK